MTTDLEELIQYWKDSQADLPPWKRKAERGNIRKTIAYLEELKKIKETK